MSTVLWANQLKDGKVESEQADYYLLQKFSDNLDSLCRKHKLTPFMDMLDSTDMMVNLDQMEMAPGMESTDELMAVSGVWTDAAEACQVLEGLMTAIEQDNTRFGLVSNQQSGVLEELKLSLSYAKQAAEQGARFNFALVM